MFDKIVEWMNNRENVTFLLAVFGSVLSAWNWVEKHFENRKRIKIEIKDVFCFGPDPSNGGYTEALNLCIMNKSREAIANRSFDVKVMIVAGFVGYLIQFFDFPRIPMVLGLILGPTAEFYLRNALTIGNGSWTIFIKRPICVVFIVLLVLLLIMLDKGNKKEKAQQIEAAKQSKAAQK